MNRTELAAEMYMGRRRRIGAVPIVVNAGATVEITDRVPVAADMIGSPWCDLQIAYHVNGPPPSNGLLIHGIMQDVNGAVFARTFESEQSDACPGCYNLRFWNCWPRNAVPVIDVLEPPDPPLIGAAPGEPLSNRIYLRSANDQNITVWLCVEIVSAAVRSIVERPKWWAIQHSFAPPYRFGFTVEDIDPGFPAGVVELTGEWPTRAQIQREGLVTLFYSWDPELGGVGVWCAVTDDAGGADPENRTAYAPCCRSPFTVAPVNEGVAVGPFPPREDEDATTLEDGTRVFLVNRDGAIAYPTSRHYSISTLNWP